MSIENIYQFFAKETVTYLSQEQAVCYILSVLLQEETYGTKLIQQLEREYPNYRLSDTILYRALKFLEDENALVCYWEKPEGRGRPRHMYRVSQEWQKEAQKLACLWTNSATIKPKRKSA